MLIGCFQFCWVHAHSQILTKTFLGLLCGHVKIAMKLMLLWLNSYELGFLVDLKVFGVLIEAAQ